MRAEAERLIKLLEIRGMSRRGTRDKRYDKQVKKLLLLTNMLEYRHKKNLFVSVDRGELRVDRHV